MYCVAAENVPQKAGIFNEPIMVTTGKLFSITNEAGTCSNPPPPTMESIKPAQNATMQSKTICQSSICIKAKIMRVEIFMQALLPEPQAKM
jgi:hypothetical protein